MIDLALSSVLLAAVMINIKLYFTLRAKISLYNRLNNADLTPPKPITCSKCKATYHRDDVPRKKRYSYDDDYKYECPHCKAWN